MVAGGNPLDGQRLNGGAAFLGSFNIMKAQNIIGFRQIGKSAAITDEAVISFVQCLRVADAGLDCFMYRPFISFALAVQKLPGVQKRFDAAFFAAETERFTTGSFQQRNGAFCKIGRLGGRIDIWQFEDDINA